MKEKDYYPIFRSWLYNNYAFKNQSPFYLYSEVRIGIEEFDVLGLYKWKKTKKYTITSIEVKLHDFNSVFRQALVRSAFCDYTYIAFPQNDSFSRIFYNILNNFKSLQFYNIGVLLHDELRKKTYELIRPKKNKVTPNSKPRIKLLTKLDDLTQGKICGLESYLQDVKK